MRINGNIEIADAALTDLCQKWRIRELSLFGSVLRDDFGPESDVDVLVTFEEDVPWGLWDIVHVGDDLEAMFGRKVDIAERPAVEQSRNYVRRNSILNSAQTIYVSR